jgi:hypothetical protein
MSRRLTHGVALIAAEDVTAATTRGSSTAHAGNSSRPLPSWPGWAPRLRPEGSLQRFGVLVGGSELGGAEELRELRFSLRSSWAIR